MRFAGQTAPVAGASPGIAAATATLLAKAAPRVVAAQRSPAGFKDIACDLSDPDAPAQVVAAAKDKAGLHGLNCAVAVDQGTAGVRCTAAAPGWIDMLLNDDFAASMPDHAGFRGRIGGLRPLRRTGKPFDVAQLIAWLGLAVAAWITGQAWTIDGGRMPQSSLP